MKVFVFAFLIYSIGKTFLIQLERFGKIELLFLMSIFNVWQGWDRAAYD